MADEIQNCETLHNERQISSVANVTEQNIFRATHCVSDSIMQWCMQKFRTYRREQ